MGRVVLYVQGEKMMFISEDKKLMKEWHPVLNKNLKPEEISVKSNKKIWWFCRYNDPETGEHDFVWRATVNSRRKNGCPYLTGRSVWKGYNDLATRRPDIAAQWDLKKNGDLKPEDVTVGSKRKVWWILHYSDPETGEYDFSWQTTVNNRVACDQGCPYLVGKAVLQGFNDLKSRYPELAMEWEYCKNRVLTPETVCVNSNKKVWWICSKGHRWRAKIQSRILGNGCPVCAAQKRKYGYFEG